MATDASCFFNSWVPAAMQFCEAPVFCFPKFPSDTISNLGPLLGGIVILRRHSAFRHELRWLGWAAVATAIFSALFHGTGTRFGEYLDLFGMYAFIAVCLALTIWRCLQAMQGSMVVMASMIFTILVMLSVINIHLATPAFAVATIAVLFLEFRASSNQLASKHLRRAALYLGIAFSFWVLDYTHILCNPENHLLTGHSIWHLMNGLVFFETYRYYEEVLQDQVVNAPRKPLPIPASPTSSQRSH